ncbi:MAG: hypothetical protein WCE30_27530 [Mycobacterium sp.]
MSQTLQLAVQVADLKYALLVYTSGPATAHALDERRTDVQATLDSVDKPLTPTGTG